MEPTSGRSPLFALVLPIALAALALGVMRLQNVTEPQRGRLDLTSVILSVLGFGGVVHELSNIGPSTEELRVTAIWLPGAIGVVALVMFIARQIELQKKNVPLLDLRTFRTRAFTIATHRPPSTAPSPLPSAPVD